MLLINDFWCKLLVIATDYQYITRVTVLAEYSAALEGLKVIYHPLYGMNNYSLIWGDWLSCDPLRGSHDSQSPHIWGD